MLDDTRMRILAAQEKSGFLPKIFPSSRIGPTNFVHPSHDALAILIDLRGH
jgi:hypothetical protein